jgi:uncharacterized protein YhjY with autotransporter beta-barrel domain
MKLRSWLGGVLLGLLGGMSPAFGVGLVPAVSIEAGSDAAEPSVSGQFVVTLDQPAGEGGVTVSIRMSGTALSGADYAPLALPVVFAAGQTSATLILTPIDDGLAETDETVVASVALGQGYTVGEASVATLMLVDDDAPPTVTLWASQDEAQEDSDFPAILQVSLDRPAGPNGLNVAVNYQGTATPFGELADFDDLPNTVFVLPGETSAELVMTALSDQQVEGAEYLDVELVASGGNYTVGSPNQVRVSVIDREYAGTLAFYRASYRMAEGSTPTTAISLVRRDGGQGAVSVSYIVSSGTATDGDDFVGMSGSVTWQDGETGVRTFLVSVLNDDVRESAETIQLRLIGTTGGAALGAQDTAVLNVIDDDVADKALRVVFAAGGDVIAADPNSSQTFSIKVVDAAGEPVADADLNWSLNGAAASAGGALQADSVTNSEGEAEGVAYFGALPALYEIEVEANTNIEVHGFDASAAAKAEIAVGLVNVVTADTPAEAVAGAVDAGCAALADAQSQTELDETQLAFLAFCGRLLEAASGEDADKARDAVAALTPRTAAIQPKLGKLLNDRQVKNITQRLRALRAGARGAQLTGINWDIHGETVPAMAWQALGQSWREQLGQDTPWGIFVNGSLSQASQDDTAEVAGYDADSVGLTAGMDRRLGAHGVVGMALGYSSAGVDVANQGGALDHQSFNVTLYGTWYRGVNTYWDGSLSLGYGAMDIERRVDAELLSEAPEVLRADTNSQQASLTLGGGYEWGQWRGFTGALIGRVSGQWIKTGDYEEEGDSVAALAVDAQSDVFFDGGVGLQFNRPSSFRWGVLNPQLSAEYLQALGNDNGEVSATLKVTDESAFSYREESEQRGACRLGGGLVALWPGGFSAYAQAAFVGCRSGYNQQDLSLGGRWELTF